MKYLLKNGTVVTGEKSEQLDILVEGEKIVQVEIGRASCRERV